jgi:dihydrofolate reductase
MRKLILTLSVTPDGFCNHQDAVVGDDWMRIINDLTERMGAAMFGRVTYKLFEEYWPQVAIDRTAPKEMIRFADLIDGIEKIVYSRSMQRSDWRNTTVHSDLNRGAIDKLKKLPGKDIMVFGSPGLCSQLIAMDAVDEYYMQIQPLFSGSGYRLFTKTMPARKTLDLLDTKTLESGVLLLHYRTKF